MKLYNNPKATNQLEIVEITYEKETFRGKTFYSVQCIYLKDSIANNGDKIAKKGISTNMSKKELSGVKQYFQNLINSNNKENQ